MDLVTRTDIAMERLGEPISTLEVLEDAIYNAGFATSKAERLIAERAAFLSLWDDRYGQELSDAQGDVDLARANSLRLLQELGIKTKECGHWTAQDVVRNEVTIKDETKVKASLMAHGRLSECVRLDLSAVKRLAKEGLAIGGIETVANHSLRLTRSGE